MGFLVLIPPKYRNRPSQIWGYRTTSVGKGGSKRRKNVSRLATTAQSKVLARPFGKFTSCQLGWPKIKL
jgi:hypothetical protein